MSKPKISERLAVKSLNAAKSAIELFNKPTFDYKDEAFVILMANAWELLVKAKILHDYKQDKKSIYVQEKSQTKKGGKPKRFYPAKNRCGNSKTIDIFEGLKKINIEQNLKAQIELLVELRDNAIHFVNDENQLSVKIFQVATATVRSFVKCYREWFPEIDIVAPILPVGFQLMDKMLVNVLPARGEAGRILDYIKKVENKNRAVGEHAISFEIDISLKRSANSQDVFRLDNKNPKAFPVRVLESDLIDSKFKIDYYDLQDRIRKRKPNIKFNSKFTKVYKEAKENKDLCLIRHLDPRNQKSAKKNFFCEQTIDYILSRI